MGVYIESMEMPTENSVIVKIFPDGRVGTIPYVQWFKIDLIPGTQAVPVPPHGRLIDADALRYRSDDSAMIAFDYVTRSQINATPTIIPAEEGET